MRAADRLCTTPEDHLYDANRATHCLITEGFFLTREDSSLPNQCIRPYRLGKCRGLQTALINKAKL